MASLTAMESFAALLVNEPNAADASFSFAPEKDESHLDDYIPTPTAQELHASSALLNVLIGPWGCGKSFASWRHMLGVASQVPSTAGRVSFRLLAMRNTAQQTVDTMLPSLVEAFPASFGGEWVGSRKEFNSTFVIIRDDRPVEVDFTVLFRSFEDPRDERKLKSLNITAMLASEFSELRVDLLSSAFGRTGRWPKLPRKLRAMCGLWETNNFHRSHPAYNLLYRNTGIRKMAYDLGIPEKQFLKIFRYPGGRTANAENTENLAPNYYATLAAVRGKQWAKVYIDNEFGAIATGRQCLSNFDDDKHVADFKANSDWGLRLAADAGKDSAYCLYQKDPLGRHVVVDEFYVDGEPLVVAAPAAADYFMRKYPPGDWNWEQMWVDPGAKAQWQNDNIRPIDYIEEAFMPFRMPVRAAGTNDPNMRIEACQKLLGQSIRGLEMFLISRDCHHTIDSMNSWQWSPVNVGNASGEIRYHDVPEKSFASHIAEAVCYGCVEGKGVNQIGRPDSVHGPAGIATIEQIDFDPYRY